MHGNYAHFKLQWYSFTGARSASCLWLLSFHSRMEYYHGDSLVCQTKNIYCVVLQEKFGVLWTPGVKHFVLTYSQDVQVIHASYWIFISVPCCLNPNWPHVLLFLTRSDQYLNSWRFWAIYHLHGLGCYNFDFSLIMVTVIPREALKDLLHSRHNLSHQYGGEVVWTNQAYW